MRAPRRKAASGGCWGSSTRPGDVPSCGRGGTGAGDAEFVAGRRSTRIARRRRRRSRGSAPRRAGRRCELAKAAAAVLSLLRDPLHTDMRKRAKLSTRPCATRGRREKGLRGAGAGLRFPQSGARRRGGVLARRVDGGRRLCAVRVAGRRLGFARGVRPLLRRRRRRRRPAGREGFRCVRAADVVVPARCFKTWRVVDRAKERLPGGARGRRLPRRGGLEARRRRRRQGGLRRRLAPGDRRGHFIEGPIINRGRVREARDVPRRRPVLDDGGPVPEYLATVASAACLFHHRKMVPGRRAGRARPADLWRQRGQAFSNSGAGALL